MPEGPEIHRIADRLTAAVLQQPLVRVEFAFPGLKPYERKLRRHEITSITARGKALLTAFDNGWTMYSHNQLYGVWKIAPVGERPTTKRSLRVALETKDTAILLYSAFGGRNAGERRNRIARARRQAASEYAQPEGGNAARGRRWWQGSEKMRGTLPQRGVQP